MMQQENETNIEGLNVTGRLFLTREAKEYADRIVGHLGPPYDDSLTQTEPSPESPFAKEKMCAAYAVSHEAGWRLTRTYEEARSSFDDILFRLLCLSSESNATRAWHVLDSHMSGVWESISRLQACDVDTQPLVGIARYFDAWVQSERENPARLPPAPPPTFAERVRGSVARMWGMGR
jgi:hypothetical protein